MNTALIFAGGTGKRMNSKSKPKQFLELHGKPIIIYTLEYFQNHEMIDNIAVVCVSDWISYLKDLITRFNIAKVKWIIEGGETSQLSIKNGLDTICNDKFSDEDIVLVHDGVRPLINTSIITKCINTVKEFGSAITTASAKETVVSINNNYNISQIIKRSTAKIARAPQCFFLIDLLRAHKLAEVENITDFIDSTSLMMHYGYELHTVDGPDENIKITTAADFFIFRAIIEAKENSQIFGL